MASKRNRHKLSFALASHLVVTATSLKSSQLVEAKTRFILAACWWQPHALPWQLVLATARFLPWQFVGGNYKLYLGSLLWQPRFALIACCGNHMLCIGSLLWQPQALQWQLIVATTCFALAARCGNHMLCDGSLL